MASTHSCSFTGECFTDLLFNHTFFRGKDSRRPVLSIHNDSLGNHGRKLHSFTPFTPIHSLRSREQLPLRSEALGHLIAMEKKTNKDKYLVVGMPRKLPREKVGTSQRHPGRLGPFMWKFQFKGQNVRGTDGTFPCDRWDISMGQTGHTPRGVRPKFFMFIGFFLSPSIVELTYKYTATTRCCNATLVAHFWYSRAVMAAVRNTVSTPALVLVTHTVWFFQLKLTFLAFSTVCKLGAL